MPDIVLEAGSLWLVHSQIATVSPTQDSVNHVNTYGTKLIVDLYDVFVTVTIAVQS
jgi:hypothetical protein